MTERGFLNEEDRITRAVLAASRGAFLALAEPKLHLGDAARKFNYGARTFEGDAFENAFEWAREEMKGFDSKKMFTPELLSAAGHLYVGKYVHVQMNDYWCQEAVVFQRRYEADSFIAHVEAEKK